MCARETQRHRDTNRNTPVDVGCADGWPVGIAFGIALGTLLGHALGTVVGCTVGEVVGGAVGVGVGEHVSITLTELAPHLLSMQLAAGGSAMFRLGLMTSPAFVAIVRLFTAICTFDAQLKSSFSCG